MLRGSFAPRVFLQILSLLQQRVDFAFPRRSLGAMELTDLVRVLRSVLGVVIRCPFCVSHALSPPDVSDEEGLNECPSRRIRSVVAME